MNRSKTTLLFRYLIRVIMPIYCVRSIYQNTQLNIKRSGQNIKRSNRSFCILSPHISCICKNKYLLYIRMHKQGTTVHKDFSAKTIFKKIIMPPSQQPAPPNPRSCPRNFVSESLATQAQHCFVRFFGLLAISFSFESCPHRDHLDKGSTLSRRHRK